MATAEKRLFGSPAVHRQLRNVVFALLLVAATTLIILPLSHLLEIRRGSVVYLMPVLIAGSRLGMFPALVAAVAGVLLSGYFFFSPFYSFYVARPNEILNLTLFMVVAVVTSHLANSMKRQTDLARKRENEMSSLYAFSRRLAAAPSAEEIYTAIEDHLTDLVQRKVVLVGAASAQSGEPAAHDPPLPQCVQEQIERVQSDASLGTTLDDGTGNIWLVRRVSNRTPDFGVIAIDLGRAGEVGMVEVRQRVDEVLADATATLERLDVARVINEARMRSETELLREALIGSVSHELRTPLSSILGAATVLSGAPAVAQDERLSSLAGIVRDEADRLNNDIQNLLDATRISREQVQPRRQWVEPVDIVNTALDRRRRRLASHPVSLDMDNEMPLIYVDPKLIEQAFGQVIDNAAKYSPPGSLIDVSARRNGHDIVLTVRDHGAGLTTEEQEQLGERFFRGPRHVNITGSGLGLWVARAFVAANGGRIQATSQGVDRGTTVSIHLPLATHSNQPEVGPDD